MKLLILLLLVSSQASSLDKLESKYLIEYGNPSAPNKIIEYFSFQCPHCLAFYRKDFKKIKENFIDTDKVHWIFHPIPTDLPTVQGMICLAELTPPQKRLFLEALFEETEASNLALTTLIMEKVMELLKKPIGQLSNESYLENSKAFSDAFTFLTQEEKIEAVPTIELNAKIFPKEVPDYRFVQQSLKGDV